MPKLKMHIVIRWDLSAESSVIAAAHAGLGTYLTFQEDPLMQEWQKTSFIKIIHRPLNKIQWDYCRKLGDHRVFTESKLDNLEVSVGFNIVKNPSILFSDIPLWTQNPQG